VDTCETVMLKGRSISISKWPPWYKSSQFLEYMDLRTHTTLTQDRNANFKYKFRNWTNTELSKVTEFQLRCCDAIWWQLCE